MLTEPNEYEVYDITPRSTWPVFISKAEGVLTKKHTPEQRYVAK